MRGLAFVTVMLAVLGLMGPVFDALAHNARSLLIVLNSARLLGFKEKAA
jgi:cation transport ATPase